MRYVLVNAEEERNIKGHRRGTLDGLSWEPRRSHEHENQISIHHCIGLLKGKLVVGP